MTTDRELLELAAKAAELKEWGWMADTLTHVVNNQFVFWEPLTDDGDALRLAVKLCLPIEHFSVTSYGSDRVSAAIGMKPELYGDDPYAATRRAIVRAAASIGQQKGE